jgi:hypothetical protein
MTRAAAAAIVLLVTVSVTAAEVPAARLRADGTVAVSLPSSLLARRDVQRQLTSGLTTTFVVIAESRGQRGGARISIRYEPWDEVYLVATRGIDRSTQSLRFATVEKLKAWWRDAAVPALPRATADTVQLTLEVLPFSIEEQRETQQWLSRALGDVRAEPSTPEPDEPAGAGAGTSVLDVIVGTSIQRRPIVRYRWTVPVIR